MVFKNYLITFISSGRKFFISILFIGLSMNDDIPCNMLYFTYNKISKYGKIILF